MKKKIKNFLEAFGFILGVLAVITVVITVIVLWYGVIIGGIVLVFRWITGI